MAIVLITGGTGMIGKRLSQLLIEKGYEVTIMSRQASKANGESSKVSFANWDIANQTIDKEAIAKADYIIHLAGAGVADKRWSTKRKQEIVNSRTKSSELIVKALTEIPNHITSVVSTSAIGWYGPDTEISRNQGFTEEMEADDAFLGETCRLWEKSIEPVTQLGKRLVKLRVGIVLSNNGGAFVEFKKPLKAGVATILGNGQQVISWIHVDDLCRMFLFAIENQAMQGVYNAVAPHPVTNEKLTLALAKKIRASFYIPLYVPAWLLNIILGEMSIEVLKSATVSCRKLAHTDFNFLYPTIDKALEKLVDDEN